MLSKIFKKNETPVPTTALARQPAAASPELIAAQLADKAAWESKLHTAMGDDAALLAIAKESPLIDVKHAAVEALVSEDALKRAEREFRDHDRRVHRTAKQRYEMLVNRRVAAVSAAKLIETASVLLHETSIPANRLVELDRAWGALDQTLLEDKQTAEYHTLWSKLSALTRERGELQLQVKRWLADADTAWSHLNAVCSEVADGTRERSAFIEARTKVEAMLAAIPATQVNSQVTIQATQVDAKSAELQQALHLAAAIDARLALLEELQPPMTAPGTEVAIAEMADSLPVDVMNMSTPPKQPSLASRWRALAPVMDQRIAALLDAQLGQWQTAKSDQRQARVAEAKLHAKEESKAAKQARSDALAVTVTGLVEQAEVALASGHIAETTKYLTAIDVACSNAKGATLEKAVQARIEILQTETARLKGWQHWGGGRVRDDLVVEAEVLATASSAEKLAVKQHADAIENLRNRWKELDKLGGATSQPLWQRFDSALKTAYLPVAAHLAKLQAVRQENLATRKKLLDELDAVAIADSGAAGTNVATPDAIGDTTMDTTVVATPDSISVMPCAAPDWRALTRAIEHFQTEWRKCGPVEHTVPHKAQAALDQRMRKSIARLEAPLSEARRVAQLEREELIVRAKALAADIRSREVITKVRQLQTDWQTHAKTLPLMRQIENALWKEFKAATDAVFTQRDALHATRDAEFKTNQAAREAIIARLTALNADTPLTEIKRTLSEVDTEWRKCGDAPRAVVAKLESAFRVARDVAQQYLAGSAKRGWHNICDTLDAKLTLCAEAESAATTDEVMARWALLAALPGAWEKVLNARIENAQRSTEEEAEEIAMQLLQLESALEIESMPAFHAARRELKLRAMKAAIEGRQSASITNADIERWLAEVIAQPNADAITNERVDAIIAALRNKPLR